MDVDSVVGGGTGSARRRRERRLRQFLRHECLSVAMALSEKEHHTSRGQRKDRAGGEARDVPHGRVPEGPPPRVPSHPVWVSRGGHRNGSSSAPWSSSPAWCSWSRFWIFLCRRWFPFLRRSGTAAKRLAFLRLASASSHAGDRSAQDLAR